MTGCTRRTRTPTAIARLIAAVTIATLIACGNPPPAATITSVTIDGGDRTIVLGAALTLTATVATTGNASTTVTWTSSDETVATIAPDGQPAPPTSPPPAPPTPPRAAPSPS